jgi:2-C-methyl-D-erythritol 2,4-cyclodiphosphate synthase
VSTPAAPGLRVGLGFDVHAFGGDQPLVLGGVTIPGAPGLIGHSDADVVAHAVADALLGAAGLPDLGTLFPASDDRYHGASSLDLLRDVVTNVAGAGWSVVNVDVVIAAEHPKLAEHIAAMAANLTDVCGGPVNVKPKHAEGVGAIGRGDGIAAWSVALLVAAETAAPA